MGGGGTAQQPLAEMRIAELLTAWRQAGRPIFHVRHNSTIADSPYRPGQQGNDFKSEARPAPGETIIPKHTNSAFIGTDFERLLREVGISALAVVGVVTNNSVEATVRMAGNLGFEPIWSRMRASPLPVLTTKVAFAAPPRSHAMSLANLDREYCRIIRTKEGGSEGSSLRTKQPSGA